MNEAFITNVFENVVFTDESVSIDWNSHSKDGNNKLLDTDFYRLRLDTFYTFDPSINSTYSGRLYEQTAYISEIDEGPAFLAPQEGIFGYTDIKNFSYNVEDYNGEVGLEVISQPARDKSSVLDVKLTVEWWHLESTKEGAFYLGMQKDITDNLYQSKPVVSFSEDTIRPMEIYSKAHMVTGSEDGSSRLQAYSGWDKVAGVWFDEDSNIQYSGKDGVGRSAIDNTVSYEQYEIPDSGYQHYENELYTKYRIVYSGKEANKYKDARQLTFTRNDNESVSVERKITRASHSDDFFDDWETISENAGSPFLDSEELFNYVSEELPVKIENVYEVVPYTGNTSAGEDYAEIDIIPDVGWDSSKSDYLPLCLKEDELFFRDGCNVRIRQEGMLENITYNKYSEAKIYFQDTNEAPLSGYKVEFQVVPPDESRILQLQNVEKNLSDGASVYFLGQAKGGDSVGEAVWDEEHYSRKPTDSQVIAGISPDTAIESSRKITLSTDYDLGRSIDRGTPISPRVVPEEEYSVHSSGQKYIAFPHGVYPRQLASRNFSTAGDLYVNFSERSFFDIRSRSFYEQKINREDGVYFKDEREIRTFESGTCDGLASTDLMLEPKDYKYEIEGHEWEINLKRENGTELGIRDGIISCEPEGDEENYFFSTSNPGPTDTFRGNGRLNYLMTKDYVQNSYGNVLEMEVIPNEKVSLDLPENLFSDGEIYYVERDVYVARDEGSQANYLEPENAEYLGRELHYLTQTFHETEVGEIPRRSPLNSPDYFNQQRKYIEQLKDTDKISNAIDVREDEEGNLISYLVIPELKSRTGAMVQKAESKYFPDKDGSVSSGGEVSFSGLTPGNYYELQINNNGVWETAQEGDFAANKKAKGTGLSFSEISDGTYRLEEWVKQYSYGSVPQQIEADFGVLDSKIKYRLVQLEYSMSLKQNKCNWIINRNTFINSNVIHDKALSVSDKEIGTQGFISTIVPGDDYLYIYPLDTTSVKLEKDFIMSSVFSLPNNPHALRNMEGTPFKSASALREKIKSDIDNPDYLFNGELLPYYIEARGNISTEIRGSRPRVKGGAAINKAEGEYAYDSFSRLRITKYVYKIYKKHATLLGDLAKRNGERDYGGWDFELDKSVKDNSGSWGDWQSANVISTDKIRSNYYPAGTVHDGVAIPRSLYFKSFGLPESDDSGNFDDGHTIDAVMLTTDETEKYEPTEIRFRIKKKQIIETDSECKVLSKYNFLPLSLSWDFLKGAINLAEGLTGGGPYEIELTDSGTNSYAIKKAEGEEVMLLNGEEELAVYGLVEDEESGLVRRRKISDLKVGEPIRISNIPQDADGKVKLKIVSSGSGDVLTEILKLPTSYTIRQIAKVNDEIKTTHERMVQGHEANLINIGECGDEIYSAATDFECMNEDSGPLVNYEVVASGFGADEDDTTVTLGGNDVGTGYLNEFYNPPFQTSNFTISGDNAGVFVCSGLADIEVTVDTDKDFHVINVNKVGDSDVTVNFDTPLTLAPQKGTNQDGQTKDVAVLGEATYNNDEEYIVLSDYSRIPDQHNFDDSSHTFKLIEDENIYLEQSDNDKQIVFDCLSKINLPSSPTTFSFTGVNIATESIPIVSPNNHLINGELVHYLKPRSESKISYANNAFSIETISELETTIARENIDSTKLLASAKATLNSSSLESGQIYTTTKSTLEITLHSGLANEFTHAFVIKSNSIDSNYIEVYEMEDIGGHERTKNIHSWEKVPGIILNGLNDKGERNFTSITKNFPRATLGTKAGESNFSMASDAALSDWIVPNTSSANFDKRINHIKLDSSSPETTEMNISASAQGNHIYIRNTSDDQKFIEFYDDENAILSYIDTFDDSPKTVLAITTGELVRIKFVKDKNQYTIMSFNVHSYTSNWGYSNNPTGSTMVLPDLKTLVVPFSDSIVAKSSLIKVTWHEDWGLTNYGENYIDGLINDSDRFIYYLPEGEEFYSESTDEWLNDTGNYTRENTTDPRGWTGIAVEKIPVSLGVNEEIIFYVNSPNELKITLELSEDAEKGATILYGNLTGSEGSALEPRFSDAGKRETTTYSGKYYKSSDMVALKGSGSHHLIIPEICFSDGGLTNLVGGLTSADDFKVIVLPNDAPNGGTYRLDYSKFTDLGDKIFVVPLYNELPELVDHRYTSTVKHKGQQFYWPEAWDDENSMPNRFDDPNFETEEDDNDNVISVEISTTKVLAFERKNENGENGIHISMLVSEAESSENDPGPVEDEIVRVVKAGEKIIRIASEEVGVIDLSARIAGSDHSEILIINETLEGKVGIITGSGAEDIFVEKRSAAKFTYKTVGAKYEKSDVQFYEVVYYSEYEDDDAYDDYPKLKTNKFYDKSDYNNLEVLLFNTSVKIEGTSSTASKWIDGEKYRCSAAYNQIKYAYSASPDNNKYSILESPLHVRTLPSNGYVINKSNSVVGMGAGVLYSDEAWFNGGYLRSLNLRDEDFFVRLSNHTVIPRYNLGTKVTLEEELEFHQEEVTNFCRINKLSPRANNDRTWEWDKWDNIVSIDNEQGWDWPDGGLYKYGIKLYGNQLNSSKKINFEFDYHRVFKQFTHDVNSYNDLIYGKKIPSRALAGAIGFSVNTGHESIVKCTSFNERTGEVTFSGIKAEKKYLVVTQGYIPLTNSYIYGDEFPADFVHPVIKYNGNEYKNGEEFIGVTGLSTYSLKSLNHANVKVSLLSDFIDNINELQEDPDQKQTINQVVNPPVAESESAWVKMPSSTKTITVPDDVNPEPLIYKDGAASIIVDDENHNAALGEVYSFPNGVNFTIDLMVGKTLYGTLVGGNLYCPTNGIYDLSKEIKDSQEWGTVIKDSELLSGYRWSNFQVYHTSNYGDVRDLLTEEEEKQRSQWYFIIIKSTSSGETKHTLADYTSNITSDLIKIKENKEKGEIYILRREYEDDPQFNKYSEIKGVGLTEPAHDDGTERVKIGKTESFVPNDNYQIISTDNQAFKDELSVLDSERAKASEKGDQDPIRAETSLELRNETEEQIALNPTKNYANEVGLRGEKTFYTSDTLRTSEKIKVRLSRLIGKRVVLKDYTDNQRVKNLESLNVKPQLKYILEGELRSAYAYDEQVCKGLVSLGSVPLNPKDTNTNTIVVDDGVLKNGDAIIFETVEGSSVTLETYKVYFVESIDSDEEEFYLLRAKKLGLAFKEEFTGLDTDSKFRIVSETDSFLKASLAIEGGGEGSNEGESGSDDVDRPTKSFCCLDSNEYVIINETCFKINPAFQNDEEKIEGGVLGLELESYSFEYREQYPYMGGENYPLSVSNDNILDIFESRNNFVKNFYVLKYHKEDKKTAVIHLTKGRTYRYFIINKEGEINVDKIVHGPSDTITSLGENSKGTFEAKQEKVEIVFNDEVEIKNLSSYICILEELKYEEVGKNLIFKPHSSGGRWEVGDAGFHSILRGKGRLGYDTGLEDIFLDMNGGRIYDTILPAEISEIYPHEKEIAGGKVELSWIISEEYWEGFWFKTVNYLPKYYTCTIYKKDSNDVENKIDTRTVENFLYPRVLAEGGFLRLEYTIGEKDYVKELVSSGGINYDKRTLIHIIEGDDLESGTLKYKAGTNEDYLLYDNQKYAESASIAYVKGRRIELISKAPEIERQSFTTVKEEGDTFRVEIANEALFSIKAGFNETVEPSQISSPLRLPLNWVSTFSASDIQNTQKFNDSDLDITKVRFEIFSNINNKGIVIPDSLLRVNVPVNESGNPKRFPAISSGGETSECLDLFRNIFYHINFTKAKACIYDPIIEGRISNVRVLDNGKNYLSQPTLAFDEPPVGYQIDDGTGKMIDFTRQAEGTVKLDAEGKVSRVEITDPGAGYGWKEGGYPNEKSTDVHPSAYTLLKIKSGDIVPEILGTNHFVGQKFFSYGYQLANATKRKVDPVAVTIKANPDDSSSNVVSMGVSSEELDAISEQQFRIKEMSVDDIEAKSYLASEMSEKVLICGSSKLSGTSIPEGGHQDNFTTSTENNPQDAGLIQVTPDDGGSGAEDGEDEAVSSVPLGTSELDNREADVTVSESLAKALGIVNTTSLADYRTIKRPDRNPYPWLSGMSSSTRPDYPMFFGTAPGTEISADAFNNMVDAANSLNKVSVDLPVYVRIAKFVKYIYTAVGHAGLSLSFDKANLGHLYISEDNPEGGIPSVPNNDVWCGPNWYTGKYATASGKSVLSGISKQVLGWEMPFDKVDQGATANARAKEGATGNEVVYDFDTLDDRRITTSMNSGRPVATFEHSPEKYVKEMRSVVGGDIESSVTHDLLFGCFAKGYNSLKDVEFEVFEDQVVDGNVLKRGNNGYQAFVVTTQVWTEYEILPFGSYAKAALGTFADNLNKDEVTYNGLIDVVGNSCSWGPKGKVNSKGGSVKIQGNLFASYYTDDPIGTTIYGPITNNYPDVSYPVVVPTKGEVKIDPLSEVGGVIYGIYGKAGVTVPLEGGGMSDYVPGHTFCAPSLYKTLTFPRGRADGFMINLDINKTNGADCF